MNEKRFECIGENMEVSIKDNESEMSEYPFSLCCESVDDFETLVQECLQMVGLLNEQQAIIDKLDQENADILGARIKAQEEWEKCTDKLKEKIVEQQATIERLQEKVTDYEIILSITDDKRTLCKEQQIDDVAFYCERYSDYRCYPLCPNTKDCFKADGTFQEKLKDLKEFWGEKWK